MFTNLVSDGIKIFKSFLKEDGIKISSVLLYLYECLHDSS
jgi:hypothetical protein